jgi:ribonuclease HI
LNLVYFDNNPIGFFYRVAERGICGVGIVLKLSTQHFFKAYFAIGVGSNTKTKLLGLWDLLSIANGCHIEYLMVTSDLRVVIDWMDGKYQLEVLNLRLCKVKIHELKLQFRWLKGLHVHRQFNSMTDSLSKLALEKQPRWFHFEEIYKDSQINYGQFYVL